MARRSPKSSKTKKRTDIVDLLVSLSVLVLFGVGALFVVMPSYNDHEDVPESRQLEAHDEPLMTDDEKRVANARGIVEFHVNGKRYHDADLPKEYYRQERP